MNTILEIGLFLVGLLSFNSCKFRHRFNEVESKK